MINFSYTATPISEAKQRYKTFQIMCISFVPLYFKQTILFGKITYCLVKLQQIECQKKKNTCKTLDTFTLLVYCILVLYFQVCSCFLLPNEREPSFTICSHYLNHSKRSHMWWKRIVDASALLWGKLWQNFPKVGYKLSCH